MQYVIVGIAGLAAGVLLATARVPRLRWVPFLALFVLLVIAAVAGSLAIGLGIVDGLVFLAATVASSVAYAAWLWRDLGTVPGTFWQLVRDETLRPESLRAAHLVASRQAAAVRDPTSAESPDDAR
ncbi:hypothetical protein ABCS02_08890 [Microbacterium sp. X-17]|uniref:hypothetical protein n=1 Tax=Microbacterium sp. X-17 TaxID=3144404 RepID=UPI0031F4F4F8